MVAAAMLRRGRQEGTRGDAVTSLGPGSGRDASSPRRNAGCDPGDSWSGAPGQAGDIVRLGPGSGRAGGRRGGACDPGDWSPGREGVAPGEPRGRYLALRAAGGAEGRRVLPPGPSPSPDPAPTARSLQPPPPPLSTNPGRVTSADAP